MTWDEVVAIGLALPGVELSTSWRTPALKIRGKLLARLREDGETVVLPVSGPDEREALLTSAPAVYTLTDHYRNYPLILARLAPAGPEHVAGLRHQTWRAAATKRQLAAHDGV